MKPLLAAVNLSKSVTTAGATEVLVVKNINFEVQKGESVTIFGDPGAGKTTLMYLLAGLDIPSDGELFFRGELLDSSSERSLLAYRKRHVGIVYQSHNLISTLTALENVLLPLDFEDMNKLEATWLAEELMDKLNLSQTRARFPDQLSGDERKRVAIARALVKKPELLLADDLTAGLQPESAGPVIAVLSQACREARTACVFFTRSDASTVDDDTCLTLYAGSLVRSGENLNGTTVAKMP